MKRVILEHVQTVFDELEQALVLQHQEKYSILEDALENADDVDELKIAFEHWHLENAEELEIEEDPHDMWISMLEIAEEDDELLSDEDFDDDEEDDDDDEDEY